MYESFFGFKENPFNLTPDPKYLFLSPHHSEALDLLFYGIKYRKGFITITGNVGTGKTTLCRALLSHLDRSTKTAVVFNTSISAAGLLETINREFNISHKTKADEKRQLDILYEYLLSNYRQGGNAVLVVDEAQNLSPAVLEQIRMLSNLETETDKLLQIVLMGQTELRNLLAQPSLRQLKERIALWYDLKPLGKKDVRDYMESRLTVAGNPGNVMFSPEAVNSIIAFTRGNPRLINAVCDRALLIAYTKDEFIVSRGTVLRAIDDIQGKFGTDQPETRWWFYNGLVPAITLALMALIILNFKEWDWKRQTASVLSVAKKVAALQAQVLMKNPFPLDKEPFLPEAVPLRKPVETQNPVSTVAVDEGASLAELFRLFNVQEAQTAFGSGDVYPGLFTFTGSPELYRLFEKPFRLRVKANAGTISRYLVIRQVTTEGALAVDAKGNIVPVPNDVILTYWDGEMSWIYPYEYASGKLREGMSGLETLKVQQMLEQLGYSVTASGIYDRNTSEQVTRFQLNHGLKASGIVDTATKALLYQTYG